MTLEMIPAPDPGRVVVELPVAQVTLLEDRASVRRASTVALDAGRHRLRVEGLSPLLQDVSLKAAASVGTLGAARVVRALRIRHADRPEAVTALVEEAMALARTQADASDRQRRAEARLRRLLEMASSAAEELPEDAAWGRVDPEGWRHAFGALLERARTARAEAVDAWLAARDAADDTAALHARLALLQRPDVDMACAVELDLQLTASAQVELELIYVVPAALWRPLHRASLVGDTLRWTARAAVWQCTGEDWAGVDMKLSTARTALGTRPPLLDDDLLEVQRKSEEVRVAFREVAVQRAGPEGRVPDSVDLPGVDDGGEVRVITLRDRVTVPSDGRPALFDLTTTEAPAEVARVAAPEVLDRVVVRVTATHPGPDPLLAGPVELLRGGGPFGWTEVGFVAPHAAVELSFGPDDALRVRRWARVRSDKTDPVDRWHRVAQRVEIDLSNVGLEAREVRITERLPVSEVAEVKVEAVSATPSASPDADGFVHWTVTVQPGVPLTLRLDHTLATAPGVSR